MKKSTLCSVVSMAMLSAMTGCIDDKYDLSDIDSTVKLEVVDLVVPINLDAISMSSIISTGDVIKEENGVYAVVKTGNISANGVNVSGFSVDEPVIDPTFNTLTSRVAGSGDVVFDVVSDPSDFNIKAFGISDDITSLDAIFGNFDMDITLTFGGSATINGPIKVTGLQLQLPKGLDMTQTMGGQYDKKTGIVKNLPELTSNTKSLQLHFEAAAMWFYDRATDYEYYSPNPFDATNHRFIFQAEMAAIAGELSIADASFSAAGQQIDFQIDYNVYDHNKKGQSNRDIIVNSVNGTISYSLTNPQINDVTLDDIPDFLAGKETNIVLANPRIYFQVDNPLAAQYHLYATTGLSIQAQRGSSLSAPCQLNPNTDLGGERAFKISGEQAVTNYILAPNPTAEGVESEEFPSATPVYYSALSDVLAGAGLPDVLKINLVNPKLPEQYVENFALGVTYDKVGGTYKFVAPLQFGDGTVIVYNDKLDGWHSEDLEDLTVTKLAVSFTLESDVPMNVRITGFPIDIYGNRIVGTDFSPVDIKAGKDAQDLTIELTGIVKDLDGIEITAYATADADSDPLSPTQELKLTNIRPKVSGYFEKKL